MAVTSARPARLSRTAQNERNRAAILDAARRVFLEAGYHGATVDAVAREAGMTIGAIYSRFAGKADLFLALLDERIEERAAEFAAVAKRATGTSARQFARHWTAVMRADLEWSLVVMEFRVHAARDAELARRYSELHDRSLSHLVVNITASLAPGVDVSRARVEKLARAAMAASTGAALARAAEGDAFSDKLYVDISEGLAAQFLGLEQP